MRVKKPKFWDYNKPNFLSYLLLPLTFPIIINNFFKKKNNSKYQNIKTICIGNIYIGGTAKTPLAIKLYKILGNLGYKTATIKKYYKDQNDENKLLSNKTHLYNMDTRVKSLNEAIKDKIKVAIFDDGLQDKTIDYDLCFVCFNNDSGIGNGFLIPAGPLRENLSNIKNYDGIFLNGNEEDTFEFKRLINSYNTNIKIFETYYLPTNIEELDRSSRYLIFSGIGNPNTFQKTLTKHKFNVVKSIEFPDHYQYTKENIEKIKLQAKNLNAKILTTEKDYVKIVELDCTEINFLKVDLVIKKEEELINFIKLKL
tara:strand:- start:3029 stop:3964 length:936 start_codon:yes stop_codon:yes gene_type:complete